MFPHFISLQWFILATSLSPLVARPWFYEFPIELPPDPDHVGGELAEHHRFRLCTMPPGLASLGPGQLERETAKQQHRILDGCTTVVGDVNLFIGRQFDARRFRWLNNVIGKVAIYPLRSKFFENDILSAGEVDSSQHRAVAILPNLRYARDGIEVRLNYSNTSIVFPRLRRLSSNASFVCQSCPMQNINFEALNLKAKIGSKSRCYGNQKFCWHYKESLAEQYPNATESDWDDWFEQKTDHFNPKCKNKLQSKSGKCCNEVCELGCYSKSANPDIANVDGASSIFCQQCAPGYVPYYSVPVGRQIPSLLKAVELFLLPHCVPAAYNIAQPLNYTNESHIKPYCSTDRQQHYYTNAIGQSLKPDMLLSTCPSGYYDHGTLCVPNGRCTAAGRCLDKLNLYGCRTAVHCVPCSDIFIAQPSPVWCDRSNILVKVDCAIFTGRLEISGDKDSSGRLIEALGSIRYMVGTVHVKNWKEKTFAALRNVTVMFPDALHADNEFVQGSASILMFENSTNLEQVVFNPFGMYHGHVGFDTTAQNDLKLISYSKDSMGENEYMKNTAFLLSSEGRITGRIIKEPSADLLATDNLMIEKIVYPISPNAAFTRKPPPACSPECLTSEKPNEFSCLAEDDSMSCLQCVNKTVVLAWEGFNRSFLRIRQAFVMGGCLDNEICPIFTNSVTVNGRAACQAAFHLPVTDLSQSWLHNRLPIWLIASLVVVMACLMVVCVVVLYKRAQSASAARKLEFEMFGPGAIPPPPPHGGTNGNNNGFESNGSAFTPSIASAKSPDGRPTRFNFLAEDAPNMHELCLLRGDQLEVGEIIGSGAFGVVRKGHMTMENCKFSSGKVRTVKIRVAIKSIETGQMADVGAVLDEAKVMATVTDRHCVKLIGVCLARPAIQFVTQLMPHGDLLNYVRRHATNGGRVVVDGVTTVVASQTFSPELCLLWAAQIADGMAHLESLRIVHRDLACRNVLLQSPWLVKVSDFGLARVLKFETTNFQESEGRLPVKWLALECLAEGIFSSASDVWAYGVTIWEILTLGETPYSDFLLKSSLYNFVQHLADGGRLQQPAVCSLDVWCLLSRCWLAEKQHRPSFKELGKSFHEFRAYAHRFLLFTNLTPNSDHIESMLDEEYREGNLVYDDEADERFDSAASPLTAASERVFDWDYYARLRAGANTGSREVEPSTSARARYDGVVPAGIGLRPSAGANRAAAGTGDSILDNTTPSTGSIRIHQPSGANTSANNKYASDPQNQRRQQDEEARLMVAQYNARSLNLDDYLAPQTLPTP